MVELDELSHELSRELGEPPADWAERQHRRLFAAGALERGASETSRLRRVRWAVAGVAIAVAGVGSGLWAQWTPSAIDSDQNHVWLSSESSNEPRRTEDGSTITLGDGARGRLAEQPASTQFDLHEGRATFDVRHRPGRTWKVVAGHYELRVVGTRFSVLYTPPEALQVAVQEGVVAVQLPSRAMAVELRAGERLNADGERFVLEHVSGKPPQRSANPGAERAPARSMLDDEAVSARQEPPASAAAQATSPTRAASPVDWRLSYRQGEYRAAFTQAKQLGFDQLLTSLDAEALGDLASTARLAGESTAALRALTALERRFPSSARAADAGFLIGRINAAQGQTAQAIARLEAYLARGDGSRYALEATGRLIELYAARGNKPKARAMAERYLRHAPHGPYRRLAESVLQRR